MNSVRLLTIAFFLVYATTGASSPNLSIYLEQLGADYARISAILATHAIILMIFSYLWGRVSDRLRRRKPMVVGGLFGMSLSFGLMAIIPSDGFAWAVKLFDAVMTAAYATTSLAFLGDLLADSETRGQQMGTYRGLGSVSFALGAFGAGPIVDAFGIRPIYGLGAGLLLIAAFVALMVYEPPLAAPAPTQAGSPPPERLPVIFLLGVTLWACAFSAAYSMWPNFLTSLGYPKSTANWLWGLTAIAELPFMSLVGVLADHIGRTPVLVMGGVGMGFVLMGYLGLNRWIIGLMGVQLFRSFAYSSFTATSMIYATETGTARTRAGTVGIYNMAMSLGQVIGLAVGGQIVQRSSFQTLFWISTAIFASSGLIFALLRWRQPEEQPLGSAQAGR
jgi:MFS transporter, DHA1 family, multidrug resistance protein